MSAPAKASELKLRCRYLRRRPPDDFTRSENPYRTIAHGRLRLDAKQGSEVEVADGLENVVTYEAVDRYQPGIKPTDLIELDDGRRLNIRRIVNWQQRNQWLLMTVVHRVPAVEGIDG